MPTILLTGVTGFLGSSLAHQLLSQGYQVVALKRSYSNVERIHSILPDINFYDMDICKLNQPFKDYNRIDAIIHTATCYGRNNETSSEIFEANFMFPMRLLETATYYNTDKFFNTDTIVEKYLNNYSLSKKQFLEWAKKFIKNKNIWFTNLKLEHMYGARDDKSKFTTYVIKNCLANVSELDLTEGEQKRDFIYIDDVVSAYIALLENVKRQVENFQEYDVGSGKAVSIREFVEAVHKITQSRTQLKFGALEYRENETMESKANIEPLKKIGWVCRKSLYEGIRLVVAIDNFIDLNNRNSDN